MSVDLKCPNRVSTTARIWRTIWQSGLEAGALQLQSAFDIADLLQRRSRELAPLPRSSVR